MANLELMESLLTVANQVQNHFTNKEENGCTEKEMVNYRAGYDNAFFDIIVSLQNTNLLDSNDWQTLEKAFDKK